MNKRLIRITVAVLVSLVGLIGLIRVSSTPKIVTPVIGNQTSKRETGQLAENLKADNAVDNQHVWQISGSKLIGYRRDNGEAIFTMSLPADFTDGTALNSIGDTVLIANQGETVKYAIAVPAKNNLVGLTAQTVNAVLVSSDKVVYWEHNQSDINNDRLVRKNLNDKSIEILATFNRVSNVRLWLTANNQLIIVPEIATDLSNYDLLIFDLNKKQVGRTYQKLGYLFAVSPSGNSIYTTTYNFEKKEVESYYLNVSTNTKSKLTRSIQAEPFATGSNDTVYLPAPTDGGYDILSLNAGKVKKVNQAPFSYVSSIVVQTANQLLIGTDNGSQIITLP